MNPAGRPAHRGRQVGRARPAQRPAGDCCPHARPEGDLRADKAGSRGPRAQTVYREAGPLAPARRLPPPRAHSRLWRCVQVRPGMRRDEQPRQRVLFTDGSLRAEGRGRGGFARPLLAPRAARLPPGPRLTAAGPVAGPRSSPCGSRTSPAPGSRGPARGRSGRPTGEAVTRSRRRRAPCPSAPTRTHLVQEAKPLEGLAVLHLPRHPGPANARNTLSPRPRPSDRSAPASAQGLLGNVVPGPRGTTLRPQRSICLNCILSYGSFVTPGFLLSSSPSLAILGRDWRGWRNRRESQAAIYFQDRRRVSLQLGWGDGSVQFIAR